MAVALPIRRARRNERGYVLLMLLLTMALLIIFAAALVPPLKFQIQRDREEELIHRGTQYSRAIRGYYKKFGRYPVKIEDLENTNNLKFLRKRYKDPTNCSGGKCQDFKLLHFGEVRMMGGMLGIPGTQAIGSPGVALPGANGQNPAAAVNAAIAGQVAALAGSGDVAANNPSPFGTNPAVGQAAGSDSSPGGGDGSNAAGASGSDNNGGNSGGGATGGGTSGNPGGPGAGQVFGGGPIVGVVSTNKNDTIREFNHKKKYNQWQFIYDPGTDRGGLLMTPNQPPLTPFGQQPGMQNVNGQNAGTAPTGLQNNPNPVGSGQPVTPSDSSNPPQQQ